MGLADDLRKYAANTHQTSWKRRAGQRVPDTDDVALGNEAVDLDAVVLYADLKDSTGLVRGYKDWFASEVYKNYLYSVSRIITSHGGSITAFDGDRVMGVFIGEDRFDQAVKVGLKINWTVLNILQPAIKAKYPNVTYTLKQKVGISASKTMVSRTGIRGSNDLIWVGNAANYAAKLAALHTTYPTYITADVFAGLSNSTLYGGNPRRLMWTDLGSGEGFGKIYGSTFWWSL